MAMQRYTDNLHEDYSNHKRLRHSQATDCDSVSNSSESRFSMNKKKFVEAIANVVKESHLAIANRPQEECPFKHAESYKAIKDTQKAKTKSIKTDEGDKKVAAIMVGGCILISCLIRFLFEVLTNLALSPFRERIDWEKYWIDSDCGSGDVSKSKLICKAYQICIQELIPSLIPMSMDDIWIQILLVLVILLVFDRFDIDSKLRP
jgi:hypothetical protein